MRSCDWAYFAMLFQSTLPARGATLQDGDAGRERAISIHAPRTGSDIVAMVDAYAEQISIHAPRTGSDWLRKPTPVDLRYFNPRSPHGERHFQFFPL